MSDVEGAYRVVGIVALLVSTANAIWLWLRAPTRALEKRVDDFISGEFESLYEKLRDDLKTHDRRIQKVENDLVHLPSKDDLRRVELHMTSLQTELQIVVKVVTRLDDFMRSKA